MDELNIIGAVINTLDRISVPVTLMEQIGLPVYNSSSALKDVFKTLSEKKKKEQSKEKSEKEEVKEDDIDISFSSKNDEEEIKIEANE